MTLLGGKRSCEWPVLMTGCDRGCLTVDDTDLLHADGSVLNFFGKDSVFEGNLLTVAVILNCFCQESALVFNLPTLASVPGFFNDESVPVEAVAVELTSLLCLIAKMSVAEEFLFTKGSTGVETLFNTSEE